MPAYGMPDGFGLPVPSTVFTQYNGFRFPEGYTRTVEFDARAVPAADGRTVSRVEYALTLQADLIGYSPTDAYVVDALCKLKEYGRPFAYTGRGFGSLVVNVGDARIDCLFGPKPEGVKVTDISAVHPAHTGLRKACRITWRVVVHVLPCCTAAVFGLFPLELTYTVAHKVQPNGASVRTTRGELRVANNRLYPDSPQAIYSPDDYWEQIVPEVPVRFRREYAEREVSADRTKLTFGWTDTEFGYAVYPEGVTRAEFGAEASSSAPGLVQWTVTLRGRYDIAYGYSYEAGEKAFWTDVKERIESERDKPENKDKVSYIPVEYSVGEPDKYGDCTIRLSLTYLVAGVGLDQIIEKTGMFQKGMPDGKDAAWAIWHNSIRTSVHSPVGWLQLKFRAEDDRITDACGPVPAVVTESQGSVQQTPAGLIWQFPKPTKQGSWLHVESHLRVESDSGVVRLRTLPQTEIKRPETKSPWQDKVKPNQPTPAPSGYPSDRPAGGRMGAAEFSNLSADADGGFRSLAGGAAAPPAVGTSQSAVEDPVSIQRRVEPTIVLIHEGTALRAGYDVPVPELIEVVDADGTPIELVKDNREDEEYFVTGVVGSALVPIVGAAWRQRYVLTRVPKAPITALQNPLLDPVEGGTYTALP